MKFDNSPFTALYNHLYQAHLHQSNICVGGWLAGHLTRATQLGTYVPFPQLRLEKVYQARSHCFWGRLLSALRCAALPGQPIGEQRHAQAVSRQFSLQQRQQICPCMIVTVRQVYEECVPGIMGPERLTKSQDGNKHSLVDVNLETCLSSGGLRRMKKKFHVVSVSLCRLALILIHYDPSRQT
jgi:hypothetical protein